MTFIGAREIEAKTPLVLALAVAIGLLAVAAEPAWGFGGSFRDKVLALLATGGLLGI